MEKNCLIKDKKIPSFQRHVSALEKFSVKWPLFLPFIGCEKPVAYRVY